MKGAGVLIGIVVLAILFLALTVAIIASAPYLAITIILVLCGIYLYCTEDKEENKEP